MDKVSEGKCPHKEWGVALTTYFWTSKGQQWTHLVWLSPGELWFKKITIKASREAMCYSGWRSVLSPKGSCVCAFGLSCWCCLGRLWHLWGMALWLTWTAGSRHWRWHLLLHLVQNFSFLNHLDVSKLQLQILDHKLATLATMPSPTVMDCTLKTGSGDEHFLHCCFCHIEKNN